MIPGMNLNYVPVTLIFAFVPFVNSSINHINPISEAESPGSVDSGLISQMETAEPVNSES